MRFTVVYRPLAEYQLADIWLRATDRQAVTDASQEIDEALRRDADRIGEPDENGWRILVEPPLIVTFDISLDDCLVRVHSVRYRP